MSSSATEKPKPYARRQARRALVQAVYQWQMTDADTHELANDFDESGSLKKADRSFFDELLKHVTQRSDDLDAAFVELLDRELKSLDQVELAILRLGTCELVHRLDVPYRVVIDEYIELAKTFGAEDSHKYVNGVLDKLARSVRQAEIGGERV